MTGYPRRILGVCCTVFSVVLTMLLVQRVSNQLGDEATFTGWTLLASTAGLYLLSFRKRLIRLKLGSVSGWMQMHSYLGTFASCVFLMHIGWPVRGMFEICLATCFAIVAGSGICLAVLSRTTPKRLSALAADYHLERIPAFQVAVANDAHGVALRSSQFGEGATLAEYYQRRLLPFFRSPRSLAYRLLPNGIKRRQLLRELSDLDRYLAEDGIHSRRQLATMVSSKDDLDYHFALQTRLRLLFALHVSLTGGLALLVGVHVALVYRFQGVL